MFSERSTCSTSFFTISGRFFLLTMPTTRSRALLRILRDKEWLADHRVLRFRRFKMLYKKLNLSALIPTRFNPIALSQGKRDSIKANPSLYLSSLSSRHFMIFSLMGATYLGWCFKILAKASNPRYFRFWSESSNMMFSFCTANWMEGMWSGTPVIRVLMLSYSSDMAFVLKGGCFYLIFNEL